MALGWLIASVVNNPIGAPRSTPMYTCLPPIWGAAVGDHQFPNTCGTKMGTKNENNQSSEPKRKEGLPFKEILEARGRRALL
jgi:hypothetical protein